MTKMIKNSFIFALFLCLSACSAGYIGEQYLGAKYVSDPLGEEQEPDTDPIIRFDAFDCVTFVETSVANGDKDKLVQIRYKNGDIDFLNRNHFTESDWLQNNTNMFENVSNQYGKTKIRHAVIDKKAWFKKKHNINTKFKKQNIDLEYISYSDLQTIKNTETLIVLFIYDNPKIYDKIGTDLAVIHVGFLLPNGKLRHASSQQGRVIDVDFIEYVNKRKQNKNNIGISLVKIK